MTMKYLEPKYQTTAVVIVAAACILAVVDQIRGMADVYAQSGPAGAMMSLLIIITALVLVGGTTKHCLKTEEPEVEA